MRRTTLICTLGMLIFTAWVEPGRAQHPPSGVQIPSTSHAVSPPLKSYKGTTHLKGAGEMRVIPLRRPEKPGGGGPNAAPGGGGNWSDADLQSSYPDSQLTINKVFQAYTFTGYLPPDENLSVGINSTVTPPQTQVVSTVNTNYAVFDTSGNNLAGGNLATVLFGSFTNSVCSTENGGDPIVLFDKLDHRWLISELSYNSTFTDNHFCLAISQTSDATGAYDLYDFNFGSNLPDYPKLGIWSDGIYFSANIFANSGGNLLFQGAQACSFPRNDVTSSPGSITFTCSSGTDSSIYNILPADLEGTTLPPSGTGQDYYLQFSDNLTATSGNLLRLYQLQNGSLNVVGNLTVNDFHEACGGGTCVPQAGTTQQLDSIGDRLMYRLSYRNYGSYQQMVVNHSVQVNSGGNQTGIRWYALRNNSGGSPPFTVAQESTFSPDATYYRWMGSIAQNKNGDLGLGYSFSGVTSEPGIAVTGKLSTDSGMEKEQVLYNGPGYEAAGYSRWGDYSSVSLDPTDECSFWYTNQYMTKAPLPGLEVLWQTVIGKFSFGDCTSGTAADFSLVPQPSSETISPGDSASYTITVQSANGYAGTVDFTDPSSNCPSNATCSITPTSVTLTADGSQTATLSVTNTSSTPDGNYNISVTGTDSKDGTLTHSVSVGLTVSPPPSFTLGASPSSQTITQGGSTSYTVTVTSVNSYSGNVTLGMSGCPTGATCTFNSSTLSVPTGGSASTTLNVSTVSTITASTYSIGITADDGTLPTQSTSVGLTVNTAPAGSFSLSASPGNLTLKAGQSGSYTISVSPSGGFASNVTVTADCPSGFACSMSNSGLILGGSGSVTYTVINDSAPRRTNYTVNISASGGGVTQNTSVGLKAR